MATIFVVEIIVAVSVFIAIGFAAAVLGMFVSMLESWNVSEKLIEILVLVEYFLFSLDICLFMAMVVSSSYSAAKELVSGWLIYPLSFLGLGIAGCMTIKLAGK